MAGALKGLTQARMRESGCESRRENIEVLARKFAREAVSIRGSGGRIHILYAGPR